MNAVDIGSPTARLRLSSEPDDTSLDYLVAHLSVEGLSASKRVFAHYGSGWRDLASFFTGLAEDWRGWQGTRKWSSVESDLKIEAHHDGHVRLRVTLRNALAIGDNDDWSACADLTIEPGEQLSRIAVELTDLAGVKGQSRTACSSGRVCGGKTHHVEWAMSAVRRPIANGGQLLAVSAGLLLESVVRGVPPLQAR